MNKKILTLIFTIIALAGYAEAKPKNVLLILADDLRPELASFGADYIHSPNIGKSVV